MKLKIGRHPAVKSTKREPYNPRKHGVSMSCLNLWLTCREACRLRYVVGLKPLQDKRAFIQGDICHGGLEPLYQGLRDQKIKNQNQAEKIVLKAIETKEAEARKTGKAANLEDAEAALDMATALLPEYLNEYWGKDSKLEWTHAEDVFLVPCVDGVSIRGKFDGGFIQKRKQCLFESKFKARWSQSYIEGLILDLQLSMYLFAMKDASSVLFNIVRKPGLRRKQTEGRADFLERVRSDIQSRPDHYFVRHFLEFSATEKKDHAERIKYLVSSFVKWFDEASKSRQDLLMNTTACDGKYGPCQYLPVCANDDYSDFINPCRE